MKEIIKLNHNILKEYDNWAKANPDWNISSYLNFYYDINAAIAFSKLYFPDFLEKKGCVLLSFRYNENIFNDWYEEFSGNISNIEKMCNLYELKDFFDINKDEYILNNLSEMLETFGNILKTSWELNLSKLYPNSAFKVDVFEELDSKFITLYSIK